MPSSPTRWTTGGCSNSSCRMSPRTRRAALNIPTSSRARSSRATRKQPRNRSDYDRGRLDQLMRLQNERKIKVRFRIELKTAVLVCMLLGGASTALAQQKGQWVPGQFGLNAGVIPDPGITYANLALNYSAGQLNGPNGNQILQNVTGTYSFWVDENIFYYVPEHKILGGYFMPYIALNYAS